MDSEVIQVGKLLFSMKGPIAKKVVLFNLAFPKFEDRTPFFHIRKLSVYSGNIGGKKAGTLVLVLAQAVTNIFSFIQQTCME